MPGAGELDGGEINADDLQPVIGQCAGRRQADPAAQIGDRGAGGQQAGQLGGPAGIAADVLGGTSGRPTVITAVGASLACIPGIFPAGCDRSRLVAPAMGKQPASGAERVEQLRFRGDVL
jgi:hypothetical protein